MSSRACLQRGRECFLGAVLLSLAFVVLLQPRPAAAQLSTSDPVGFFTNLSSRLLQAEFGLSVNRIQIYPTNQYTPAVHRILQVTANILDATTNRFGTNDPFLPTVFQPLFTNDAGCVFIIGYREVQTVTDLQATPRPPLALSVSSNAPTILPDELIFGVPLIVGARKGHPNFNEFAMDAIVTIARKLRLVKSGPGGQSMITQTNQVFDMSLQIVTGVEFWNSYRSNYTRPVDIVVNSYASYVMTNDSNIRVAKGHSASVVVSTNSWKGWTDESSTSFIVPLRTNVSLFTPSTVSYLPGSGTFAVPESLTYDSDQRLLFPLWVLAVTNYVQAMVLEQGTGRIIDYVLLDDMTSTLNIGGQIGQSASDTDPSNPFTGLWITNQLGNFVSGRLGIYQQIRVARGNYPANNPSAWIDEGVFAGNRPVEIAKFLAFFTPSGQATYLENGVAYHGTNNSLVSYAPFTAAIKLRYSASWQANDPLIHQLPQQLWSTFASGETFRIRPLTGTNFSTLRNLGVINQRFEPWAAFWSSPSGPITYSIAYKDPLVRSSDDWSFPTNTPLAASWLGQVHRGTPWQTLYLKSSDLGLTNIINSLFEWYTVAAAGASWTSWTGNPSLSDAFNTRPIRDWSIVAQIASLLNTNDPRQLLSINDPSPANWRAVLDGLVVLTNITTDAQLASLPPPQFESLAISSNSPQASVVALGIAATRAQQPGQVFTSLGDLLGTPQLSSISPWLNQSSAFQMQRGITDEAYEKIPSQLLSRLRADSVGSVLHNGTSWQIQFTGFDNCPYAVESSTNLVNWTSVSTNYPTNGVFTFTDSSAGGAERFYRSVLLP